MLGYSSLSYSKQIQENLHKTFHYFQNMTVLTWQGMNPPDFREGLKNFEVVYFWETELF